MVEEPRQEEHSTQELKRFNYLEQSRYCNYPQQEFRMQVQEHNKENESITMKRVCQNPQQLLGQFPDIQYQLLSQVRSASNMPKFFMTHFFQLPLQESPLDWQERYRFLLKKKKKFDQRGSINQAQLLEVMKDEVNNKRIAWSRQNRMVLQRSLVQDKQSLILGNIHVGKDNIYTYLYYSKKYEWRLNVPELTGSCK